MSEIKVTVKGEELISENEIRAYIDRAKEKYGDRVKEMILNPDGEFVDIEYITDTCRPFHRLRRITGYLVGNMSRWNNAKRAEEKDRVKHGTEE